MAVYGIKYKIRIKYKLLDCFGLQDSWASVLGILDHFAENQDTFIKAAEPGHWNDPDMVRLKSETPWFRLHCNH